MDSAEWIVDGGNEGKHKIATKSPRREGRKKEELNHEAREAPGAALGRNQKKQGRRLFVTVQALWA